MKKIRGPQIYEISKDEIFTEADPAISSPYPGRTMELLSLTLVPDPVSSIDGALDLSEQVDNEFISVTVPSGDHALYGLVKVTGFMEVINGAPGASGPVLNHYNEEAVRKYLNRMSDTIEAQTGPLSQHIRALFTDSMELEGANWSSDMTKEFTKRRGYDIFPYLPFVLFRTGAMGNITDFKYGATMSLEFEAMIRRGRAYTMINKYVSSAAHLTGKRLISCEEMTDTYTVFNTSLENLKIDGDQTAVSGVTHSVFHGFNYSPPEAPWPGWIRYGGYFNENNTWWPWFHFYNEYKGRISSVLQNATMVADIAILPPLGDMWSIMGAQMEPFPSITHVEYMTLVWEAINKNGSGCDYVSERVISDSEMRDGNMHYGPRKYHTLFMVGVESINSTTAAKLYDFVRAGGRIFCIETLPVKSLGWEDHLEMDCGVQALSRRVSKNFSNG